MKFVNKTNKTAISDAIADAHILLNANSSLIQDIFNKNDWLYDSGKGSEIVLKLLKKRDPVDVYFYKPIYPWSSAIGHFDGEAIHINFKKILNHNALVGLLLHEYAHYCGFSHGSNYKSKQKTLYSVPYWLSENVGNYLC